MAIDTRASHQPTASSSSAVASSSNAVRSHAHARTRKSDVFKPKFPLDPFAGAGPAAISEPWFLKVDALVAATSYDQRNVVFVLGAPTLSELAPLLQSRQLSHSLVILATHNAPEIPHIVIPTVRILKLAAPLAIEDAGAVRFVNVLEWAERVARTWRAYGGSGVVELSEEDDANLLLAPPSMLHFGTRSQPPSPSSSSARLTGNDSSPSSRRSSLFRPRSSTTISSMQSKRQPLPRPDPTQRPFDALINFLSDDISEKSLLKQCILVSTISRPFLVAALPPRPHTSSKSSSKPGTRSRPRSFINVFNPSSSSVHVPPTPPYASRESLHTQAPLPPPPPKRSHLIHLLPPTPKGTTPSARRKLVESIEAFMLSFAFQPTPSLERARPFLMERATFVDPIRCEPGVGDWADTTVTEVVLSGALDPTARLKRTWIARASDIVLVPGEGRESNDSADAQSPGGLLTPPHSDESSTEADGTSGTPSEAPRKAGWRFWKRLSPAKHR